MALLTPLACHRPETSSIWSNLVKIARVFANVRRSVEAFVGLQNWLYGLDKIEFGVIRIRDQEIND